jgi:hypothetical protein
MNELTILTKEAEGMRQALEELDEKLSQAAHQRHTLQVLLNAVESAIRAASREEQLELPFPEDVVEFPTHSAN